MVSDEKLKQLTCDAFVGQAILRMNDLENVLLRVARWAKEKPVRRGRTIQ